MGKGNRSVEYYTLGEAVVQFAFPEDRVVCQWCRCCVPVNGLRKCQCALTGEDLVYPYEGRGARCPIEFPEKEG